MWNCLSVEQSISTWKQNISKNFLSAFKLVFLDVLYGL